MPSRWIAQTTEIEEQVTVSATRTDKRIEDQTIRVEVLDARRSKKAADDARRHRDDAERDGRPARAGDVAVTRGGECARPGHARPIYAVLV